MSRDKNVCMQNQRFRKFLFFKTMLKKNLLNAFLNRSRYVILFLYQTGFPIALSYPHFYQSDPKLLHAVEGLTPKQEIHESYFFIQPLSGLPVDLAFRFQINMALQDISTIDNVDGFSNLVLPLLWFEIVSLIYFTPTL